MEESCNTISDEFLEKECYKFKIYVLFIRKSPFISRSKIFVKRRMFIIL